MKPILCSIFILFCVFIHAQNGLEGIIVEKYYVSDANDASHSCGLLPLGSVTYRIYVDMLPGYKFLKAYGDPNHLLILQTTTSFFNNEKYGNITPIFPKTVVGYNTLMLDSWLSAGAACTCNFGVLKSEDNGFLNVVNVNNLLKNNNPYAGIPLTIQDGLMTGSPQKVSFYNICLQSLNVFNNRQAGNSFVLDNAWWGSGCGSAGPTSTNRVLIAQLTTDGVLTGELNIQICNPKGRIEKYVARKPKSGEKTNSGLIFSYFGCEPIKSVKIISPLNEYIAINGEMITIGAKVEGNVSSVEFFVDNISIGTDFSSPFNANYKGIFGWYTITANAKDYRGIIKKASPVKIFVRCVRQDFNNDGVVNTEDVCRFIATYNSKCTGCDEDFDNNSFVNIDDFLIFITKYNYSCK